MSTTDTFSIARAAFLVSVVVLSFLYGYTTRQNGFFPDQVIRQVQKEASNIWYRPSLTTRVYDRRGVRIKDSSAMQPGLTFINSLWNDSGEWNPGFNLVDRDGNVLHRWRVDRSTLFPDSVDRRGDPTQKILHGSYLLPDGDVVFNVDYVGAARIDACGNVVWRLPKGNHHSVARAEDETFWIPGTSKEQHRTTAEHPDGFPGLENPVWLDQLHHVSADGTLLKKINVLDLLYENDLERYIVRAYQPQTGDNPPRTADITHLNDVEPLSSSMADDYPLFEAGDLLVSLRNVGLVLVVDPATRTVKWSGSGPIIKQHDPDFTGEGRIGIFDNNQDFVKRGRMLGGSRIVTMQPRTDSAVVRFPTAQSEPFYTDTMGKWQQLANGNMLLTESKAGRVVEVSPEGQTVWELVRTPYNNSKVPRVSKASRVDLTREDVADWPCSSTAPSTS